MPRYFLLYSTGYDFCSNLEVTRKGVLDDDWCLEIDVEAACMLRLILFYNCELIAVIQVCLNGKLIYLLIIITVAFF